MELSSRLTNLILKHPLLYTITTTIVKGYQPISLDYPVKPQPRYGYGKPPHSEIYQIIDKNRALYSSYLKEFLNLKKYFAKIPLNSTDNKYEPHWANVWLPGLDAVSIYGFIQMNNPKNYLEIGSGNSTKFARRAIIDHGLQTRIISIDPNPRAEIDSIADHKIRSRLEDTNLNIFSNLQAKDVVFFDGSHRCFTNSDVTVMFLDILPSLKPGIVVGFHDIFLPFDYPANWAHRYYSEQYMLAIYLLSENSKTSIIFPSYFISNDFELNKILEPLWNEKELATVQRIGGSFWIQK